MISPGGGGVERAASIDPIADLARLPGVGDAVERARDAIDQVLRDRGRRRLGPPALLAAAQRSAAASAQLSDDRERWARGCLRAQLALPELAGLVRTAPGQVLARAHVLIAGGVLPSDRVGRPSADAADASAGEAAARLADVTALLKAPTAGPAAVLAAVAHAEIATVRPFGSADGEVARVVEHAVLVAYGVDPDAALAVAAGHAARADDYRVALSGYAGGTIEGVRGWLLHCLDALAYGALLSPQTWTEVGRVRHPT